MSAYTLKTTPPVVAAGPSRTVATARLSATAREIFDAGRFDDLDDFFLTRLEKDYTDIVELMPIIRAMVKRKETDRASTLRQFLLEACRQHKDSQLEMDIELMTLMFWPECRPARDFVVRALRTAYPDSPSFGLFVKHLNTDTASEPLTAFQQLEAWLRSDVGRAVYMSTKGVGRIKEVNLTLSTVRIAVESPIKELVSLRIGEAGRLLTPLWPGHFMREVLDNPLALQAEAADSPAEVLRRFFSCINGDIAVADVKDMLRPIVSEAKWAGWWKRAREDRRLTVGAGARPTCCWSESAADADKALASQFRAAPVREKLKMMRAQAGRSPALAQIMAVDLIGEADAVKDGEPNLALEILLLLEKNPAADQQHVSTSFRALLQRADAPSMVAAVSDRNLRRRAVTILRDDREDWIECLERIVRPESDFAILAFVYDALRAGAPQVADRLVGQALSGAEISPGLFLWVCTEMMRREELLARADWNLLCAIFDAVNNERLKPFHADLRALFDGGGAVDHIIKSIDRTRAEELLKMLDRDSRIEDYRKDQLRRFVRTSFPGAGEKKTVDFYATAASIAQKNAEYDRLVRVDIPQNTLEIQRAKEFGDLRENFEYHAARARQELLSSRAKTLHDLLTIARVLDPATVDASIVNLGTRVHLEPSDSGGPSLSVTILGPWESEPDRNVYSYETPAVMPLLGVKPGAAVEFNGQSYVVGSIEPCGG